MPGTVAHFLSYAPGINADQQALIPFLERANRWAARVLEHVPDPDEHDVRDAVSAHMLHQLARLPTTVSTAETSGIASVRLGSFNVTMSGGDYRERLEGKSTDWLTQAYLHLYDAGLPRPTLAAGAVR